MVKYYFTGGGQGFFFYLRDVRAHCYCASLVRALFISHARATSCISYIPAHRVETQQNLELMTFSLSWCANIFVGCSVTPSRSLPFLILFTKKPKSLYVGSVNYFSFSIQIGSNWYMDIGVRDLEVAFFKANST